MTCDECLKKQINLLKPLVESLATDEEALKLQYLTNPPKLVIVHKAQMALKAIDEMQECDHL